MTRLAAELNWSTHKSETFEDTGEKGLHPAWGFKSVIDRGVKTHEKPEGDKSIGKGEHQTQKRDIEGKSFKSYSMVHAFYWDVSGGLPFPGAAPPFGSDSDDDDEAESALDKGKTEHSGAKKGKGAWTTKKDAKRSSSKHRRQAGKKATQQGS